MKPSLSAILIAKNEEEDLPGCLDSLKGLAEEIVVVVSDDTTDRTEEIAKSYGAKTFRRKFDNYAKMRQASLDAATKEWCLWIDPDERVSPELKETLLSEMEYEEASAYEIDFEVHFLGKKLSWGGLGSEKHVRFFDRARARFIGGELHESLEIKKGRTIRLRGGKMIHTPYRDVADYMSKLERYTDLAAEKRFKAGKRATPFFHLIYPWELFARLVLKLGILDGAAGVTWARLSAYHSWLKYAKLRKLQEERR